MLSTTSHFFLIVGGGRLARRIAGYLPSITLDHADLNACDAEQVRTTMAEARDLGFRVVINCAANSNVGDVQVTKTSAVNSVAPGLLAMACAAYDLDLIHISTDYVFGGGHHGPYRSHDKPFPVQWYGHSKLLGEATARLHPRVRIVRVAWLYGPEYPNNAVMMAHSGAESGIWTDLVGSPTYAQAAAGAIARIAVAVMDGDDVPPVVHVSSGEEPISWFDLLRPSYPNIMGTTSDHKIRRPRHGGLAPDYLGTIANYDTQLTWFRRDLIDGQKKLSLK